MEECIQIIDGRLLIIVGVESVMLFLALLGYLVERDLRKKWAKACHSLEILLSRKR